MATVIGTYTLHQGDGSRETGLILQFDFSQRNEIVGGATILSATAIATLNNAVSTAITIGTPTVVSGTKVNVPGVTDVSAVIGNTYHLVCSATLSTGAVLVEAILLPVVQV